MLRDSVAAWRIFHALLATALCAFIGHSALAMTTIRQPDASAFSADGSLVALSRKQADGQPRVALHWTRTGKHIRDYLFSQGKITNLAICSQRGMVIVTTEAVYRAKLDGDLERWVSLEKGEYASVSPRCESVAIYGQARRSILIVDSQGRTVSSVDAPFGTSEACFLGGGATLGVLATTGAVRIVGAGIRTSLPAGGDPVSGIACIDSRRIALGGEALEIYQVDHKGVGVKLKVVCAFSDRSCSISGVSNLVATIRDGGGALQKAVVLYSITNKHPKHSFPLNEVPTSTSISPAGTWLVVSYESGAELIHLTDGMRTRLQ